jgi:hypothetical protein
MNHLVYGRTTAGRPIHAVCAYAEDDDLAIVRGENCEVRHLSQCRY